MWIALFLALNVNAQNNQNIIEKLKFPRAEAHQGGVLTGGGNTIEQFEKARKWGSDIIETDLRATKDGVAMIFHDEKINSGNCKGNFTDFTYEEIDKCSKSSGKKIPTFEKVLEWSKGRIVINAEFKEDTVIVPAIQLVQKFSAYEWVYFQTKSNPEKYKIARETDSHVALLFKPENEIELDWALSLNDSRLVAIELYDKTAKPDFIQKIRAAGKVSSYNSWRLDTAKELFSAACDKVFKMGIDIAKTNNPNSCVRQKKKFQ